MKSARIRRRNKQGFAGVGSYKGLGEKHQYGNYKDYKDAPDFVHRSYVEYAKRFGCKHPGSKRHAQLKLYMKPVVQ